MDKHSIIGVNWMDIHCIILVNRMDKHSIIGVNWMGIQSYTIFQLYHGENKLIYLTNTRVSDCCLTPTQQFFSYIMAKTS